MNKVKKENDDIKDYNAVIKRCIKNQDRAKRLS